VLIERILAAAAYGATVPARRCPAPPRPGLLRQLGMIVSVVTLTVERFEELVGDALDGIPPDLGSSMENVAVLVDSSSPPGHLLGLYQGVPLTERGAHYSATMPDRITIYMATICRACRSEDEVVAMVRKTVIHEVAHHFGIDDAHLKEWGWG
jgi:predicted Zn-dependent protease with MMP-like domain